MKRAVAAPAEIKSRPKAKQKSLRSIPHVLAGFRKTTDMIGATRDTAAYGPAGGESCHQVMHQKINEAEMALQSGDVPRALECVFEVGRLLGSACASEGARIAIWAKAPGGVGALVEATKRCDAASEKKSSERAHERLTKIFGPAKPPWQTRKHKGG
jgi:hypothetical protein